MAPSRVDAVRLAALEMVGSGPNECTNGPAAIAAATLAQYSRAAGNEEAAQEYIDQACTCFDQNIDVMASDGTLAPPR